MGMPHWGTVNVDVDVDVLASASVPQGGPSGPTTLMGGFGIKQGHLTACPRRGHAGHLSASIIVSDQTQELAPDEEQM